MNIKSRGSQMTSLRGQMSASLSHTDKSNLRLASNLSVITARCVITPLFYELYRITNPPTSSSRILSYETRDNDVEMIAGESPSFISGTTDSGESSPTPPPAKPRKHSYIIRKEKRENLMREVEELQNELQELKKDETDLLREELEVSLLRDAVRMQQLSLVNVQSAVSGYVSTQETIPHEVTICLGKDLALRREALIVAKQKKIQSSLAYIAERTRFLDPFRPFSETSRFLLDGGDYCVLRDDRTPFDASRVSVRQLCDAISAYFSNVEMCVTDVLGDITTRDEINYGVDGIQQSRFESSMTCGLPFEVNTVIFHEFAERSDEHGGGGPIGIFTMDFVDVDELHPYRPHQCVRHDVTAVLTVRMHTRKRFNSATRREEDESAIVWTRSFFTKQHRTDFLLSSLAEHILRDQLGKWGDVMMSCVLEQIYAHQ